MTTTNGQAKTAADETKDTFKTVGVIELAGRPVWFLAKPMPGRPDRMVRAMYQNGSDVEVFVGGAAKPEEDEERDHVVLHAPNAALIVESAPLAVWKEDLEAAIEEDDAEIIDQLVDVWGTTWEVGKQPVLMLIPDQPDMNAADPRKPLPMPGEVVQMIRTETQIEVYLRSNAPGFKGIGGRVTLLPNAVTRTITEGLSKIEWEERVMMLTSEEPTTVGDLIASVENTPAPAAPSSTPTLTTPDDPWAPPKPEASPDNDAPQAAPEA